MALRIEGGIEIDIDQYKRISCDPRDLPALVKYWLSQLPEGTSQLDILPCRDAPGRFVVWSPNDVDRRL